MNQRVYLDNAATSWPKPEQVYVASDRYQRQCGAAAGRGAYAESIEADRIVDQARRAIATLLGIEEPRQVVFTFNGTDALNLAIHGCLRPGDHVVTTAAEHNSVLRPLRWLERYAGVEVTRVACDAKGYVRAQDVAAALRDSTRLVAVVHASNVTGAVQAIGEIGRLIRPHPALFLVDGAQSVGHLPLDVGELGVDLLAFPGHKGLWGPLGTGALYIRPGVERHIAPLRQGGTGSESDQDEQPESLPDRFESGNHNVVGLAGLAAGVEEILRRGVETIARTEHELTVELLERLQGMKGIHLFGPSADEPRVGVVSLCVDDYSPQELAVMLESAYRIQGRAGIHCAPRIHAAMGTLPEGGTYRLSVSAMNTPREIAQAGEALQEIASSGLPASKAPP